MDVTTTEPTMPTAREIVANPFSSMGAGELLDTFLKNTDVSSRQFSQTSKITRARLDKIRSGRADPTPEELEKISQGMKKTAKTKDRA